MTCIVALTRGKEVWMGGDSERNIGGLTHQSPSPKVWKKEACGIQWLFGETGNERHQQIVRYEAGVPDAPPRNGNLCAYVVTKWIPLIRSALKAHGGLLNKEGTEKAEGGLLLGAKGQLFIVDAAFGVLHIGASFVAIGQGKEVAHGAMLAIQKIRARMSPEKRIRFALEAAESHCDAVGGRFDILHTK